MLTARSAAAQLRDITIEGVKGERRLALVIGNAGYASSPLNNTVSDARLMAQTLRDLGFEVVERTNAGYKEMRRAVIEFGDRLH